MFVRRNAHRKVMNSKYIDLCIIFVFNLAVHLRMNNQSFKKIVTVNKNLWIQTNMDHD